MLGSVIWPYIFILIENMFSWGRDSTLRFIIIYRQEDEVIVYLILFQVVPTTPCFVYLFCLRVRARRDVACVLIWLLIIWATIYGRRWPEPPYLAATSMKSDQHYYTSHGGNWTNGFSYLVTFFLPRVLCCYKMMKPKEG